MAKQTDHTRNRGRDDRGATHDTIRRRIDTLIRNSKTDNYASVSALLGRNHAYMQQYIKRKTPRTLREEDRRLIANHFGISPGLLFVGEPADGGSYAAPPPGESGHSGLPSGDGLVPLSVERTKATRPQARAEVLGFSENLLARLTRGRRYSRLVLVEVTGDAMAPTLQNGDLMLVGVEEESVLQDGLYALSVDDKIVPKRLLVRPDNRGVIVSCDNSLYSGWVDCDPASLDIFGPILWYGRRL